MSDKTGLYKWYDEMTPGGRTALVLIGTGVAIFIGYNIWKAVKEAKQSGQNLREAKDAVTTLNQLNKVGIRPTFTDAQFESWSNQLAQSFSGCGTDTPTI